MEKLSNTHCEVCLRKGIKTKVRTICKECREFLCKECSDTHLLHKLSLNHSLIDLDQPGEELRPIKEDELASDFLEQVSVSETTVLYRAQVAVESITKEDKIAEKRRMKLSDGFDTSKLKPTKCREFSVKRPDDAKTVSVKGILALADKVVIVDCYNKKLKLFDQSGDCLSSTELQALTHGITHVNSDKFATCGSGCKVYKWILDSDTILCEDEVYDLDHYANDIHFNGTYYCVLHRSNKAITVLDRKGKKVRKITEKEAFGKKIDFGQSIHMDCETHNIYLPSWSPNAGVLCMSVEGEALWFTPLSAALMGITEIHGILCLAGYQGQSLHLISKTGQYRGKLLDRNDLDAGPDYIFYDEHDERVYVSFYDDNNKTDTISVYILTALTLFSSETLGSE